MCSDRSCGSNPNNLKNSSHDDDTEWYTPSVLPSLTIAPEQLELGSSRPATVQSGEATSSRTAPKPQRQTPPVRRTRTRRVARMPKYIDLTEDGRCNFYSQSKVCGKKYNAKDMARHWLTKHAMGEVDGIERGTLDMRRARIITTMAKLRVAAEYKVYCPLAECQKRDKFLVRPDCVVRHLLYAKHKRKMSEADANKWAHDNMALRTNSSKENCWEAAVSRIYHA
jgi:hypothetical protein